MITAILTLLGTALGLAWWLLKRRYEPSSQQQLDDRADEFARLQKKIAAARARGDDAGADALLRRLRDLALTPGSERASSATGQRGDLHPAERQQD